VTTADDEDEGLAAFPHAARFLDDPRAEGTEPEQIAGRRLVEIITTAQSWDPDHINHDVRAVESRGLGAAHVSAANTQKRTVIYGVRSAGFHHERRLYRHGGAGRASARTLRYTHWPSAAARSDQDCRCPGENWGSKRRSRVCRREKRFQRDAHGESIIPTPPANVRRKCVAGRISLEIRSMRGPRNGQDLQDSAC